MCTLYFFILFISASFFLFASYILFTRKHKDCSRLILSFIMLISSIVYIIRIIHTSTTLPIAPEIDIARILTYILTTIIYPIYFFYIIYPKLPSLLSNHKIVIPLLFMPITQPDSYTINIIIAIIGISASFSPFIFYYSSGKEKTTYKNNRELIPRYFYLTIIKLISFILFISIDNIYTKSLLCIIELLLGFYILYLELYCRDINVENDKFFNNNKIFIKSKNKTIKKISYKSILFKKLEDHLLQTKAWSDPTLSIQLLAKELKTNRNTLLQAIKENGYINYNHYINNIRINNFITLIESNEINNYKDAFFEVGFHSRTTALRNFKIFTGKTPSEYFEKNNLSSSKI